MGKPEIWYKKAAGGRERDPSIPDVPMNCRRCGPTLGRKTKKGRDSEGVQRYSIVCPVCHNDDVKNAARITRWMKNGKSSGVYVGPTDEAL